MKLRTCSDSLERAAVIYLTGTKITSMSNLINQLYHASFYSYVLHCFCHVYVYMLYPRGHLLPFGSFNLSMYHSHIGISMKGAIMQGFLYLHGRLRRVRIYGDALEITLSSYIAFLYAIST